MTDENVQPAPPTKKASSFDTLKRLKRIPPPRFSVVRSKHDGSGSRTGSPARSAADSTTTMPSVPASTSAIADAPLVPFPSLNPDTLPPNPAVTAFDSSANPNSSPSKPPLLGTDASGLPSQPPSLSSPATQSNHSATTTPLRTRPDPTPLTHSPPTSTLHTVSSSTASNSSRSGSTVTAGQSSPANTQRSTSASGRRLAAFASRFGSAASASISQGYHAAKEATREAVEKSRATSRTSPMNVSAPMASFPDADEEDQITPLASSSATGARRNWRDRGTNLIAGATARFATAGSGRLAGSSKAAVQPFSANAITFPRDENGDTISSQPHSTMATSTSSRGNVPFAHTRSMSFSGLGLGLASLGATGLNRSNSRSVKNALGVCAPPPGAATGLVFGVSLNKAAQRTRLASSMDGVRDLPIIYTAVGTESNLHKADLEGAASSARLRRREACVCLPAVAVRCLDYLNYHGMEEEGLYRTSGGSAAVNNLAAIFDSGRDLDILGTVSTRDLEPSAVASVFKRLFLQLPAGLLCNIEADLSGRLIEAGADGKNPVSSVDPVMAGKAKALMIERLPIQNLILLRELAFHLAHLTTCSKKTKMDLRNFQLILSPTLRISPNVLHSLVTARALVFPEAGELNIEALCKPLEHALPLPTGDKPSLALNLPSERLDGLSQLTSRARSGSGGSVGEGAGKKSRRSSWRFSLAASPAGDSPTDTVKSSLHDHVARKRSSVSLLSHTKSWHVIDLPVSARPSQDSQSSAEDALYHKKAGTTDTSESAGDGLSLASTPIAAMFLKRSLPDSQPSPPIVQDVLEHAQNRSSAESGVGVMQRTPMTRSGRDSPSPFFGSGAPVTAVAAPLGSVSASLGHRKRNSSISLRSFSSSHANTRGGDATPTSGHLINGKASSVSPESRHIRESSEEEEELSNSETSMSVSSSASECDGTSSTETPIDGSDNDEPGLSYGSLSSFPTLEERRTTITPDTFRGLSVVEPAALKARTKRGSMMLL